MSLVGPLAAWELLRLGRGGALPKARVALALTMLVGLGLAYRSAVFRGRDDISIARVSLVAENYLVAYLAVQILAVVVLTPAVAAGAISDEKERGRLDFLRSSMLTPREIVLGKYLGRVLHLLGILATGLPILALATLFGGVDLRLLAAGTLVTVTTVCALAAYSLSLAVKRATLRDVMVTVYFNLTAVTVAGLCCGWVPIFSGLSPLWAMLWLWRAGGDNPIATPLFALHLIGVVLTHAVSTLLWLRAAVRDLEAMSGAPPLVAEVPVPASPDGLPQYPYKPRPHDLAPPYPPPQERAFVPMLRDDDDPFAWRECRFAPRYAGLGPASASCLALVLAAGVFGVAMLVFAVVFQAVSRVNGQHVSDLGTPARQLAQVVTAPATFVLMALLAVRAASSVAAERERDTLTALLVLPVERRTILWAKWSAPLRWSRYAVAAVVAVEACVQLVGGLTEFAGLAVVAQVVTALLLANTLGLWLSVACRTTTRAVAWTLLSLLTLTVAPLFVEPCAELSPAAGVWLAHESPTLTPVALQLLAAGVLGWSAVRRFEQYGK